MPQTPEGRDVRALFGLAEVEGPSMVPTLYQGDQVLVRYGARVRAGDVVILRHPLQQNLLIVKRAAERRETGWWVLADNPGAGADSTDYGTVPEEFVLGRVLGRYRPRGRKGAQRPGLLPWLFSALRPVLADRSASKRLRAR
ncbi:nickel-type superoxide dismutase maturation protease [Streptomyces sp. NA04227]|uniref:nickel-type superoxide dismutase maturation protease n=1 Tax=Streptomyces sp. NA04227 TaxID=2742136 RepID=UPI0015905BE4|nr:nickel-type superoxide dismutase maturation protease [Streptomyces sp. NA04227]QKW09134.1 nickel-type superoxide dismutase maturation protease [Streptomyces sp. NA04227]